MFKQKLLKQDKLTNEEMWRYDGLSEDNLDIAYREPEAPTPSTLKVMNQITGPFECTHHVRLHRPKFSSH